MTLPTPYYEEPGITIYCGDCREILPTLPKVDLVLTDPPYGIGYVTSWRSHNDPLRAEISGDKNLDTLRSAWPSAFDRLGNDRHYYIFSSPSKLPEMHQIIKKPKHTLAWDKGDQGTVGDLECGFGEAWEAILYGMKGRRKLNGKRPRTVIRKNWSSTMDPVHPTVKPIPLLQILIRLSTNEGEVVLDPFMGSGTTLVAAKNLGRKAIGIEIEEKYCEIAVERLRQDVLPFELPTEVKKVDMPTER